MVVMRSVARGVARFALLMLAVSFLTFLLVGSSPIDPVQANVGQAAYAAMSPDRREQLAERWDADTPVVERYLSWLGDAVQGDLGESLRFNEPVAKVVGERFASSALLLAASWIIAGAVGLVLGIASGALRDSWLDRLVRGYCYVLSATPAFWLALIALMVFAVYLGWFPLASRFPSALQARCRSPRVSTIWYSPRWCSRLRA